MRRLLRYLARLQERFFDALLDIDARSSVRPAVRRTPGGIIEDAGTQRTAE